MRWFLTTIVVVLPLIWIGAVLLLVRQGLNLQSWAFSLSDVFNVALFALTVVSIGISLKSLSIATASYEQAIDAAKKQFEAGEEQSKILQGQAEALEAARRALDAQLVLAKEQRAEYLARLAKHPRLEIQVNRAPHEPGFEADKSNFTITTQPGRTAYDFVVVIKNIGDATLLKPLLIFAGNHDGVSFQPKQFDSKDFLPFSQIKKGYQFDVRAVFPQGIDTFDMIVDVSGENMNAEANMFHVKVVSQSTLPPSP
jgi:hypothetical protein